MTDTSNHAFDDLPNTTDPYLVADGTFAAANFDLSDYPSVPDSLTAAHALRQRLEEKQMGLFAGLTPGSEAVHGLVTSMLDGRDLDDALDHAVDQELERRRRDIAHNYLRHAIDQTGNVLRDTIRDALPQLFAGLRPMLTETIETLRSAYKAAGDLDILQPDPLLVAQAPPEQQQALVTIAEQTRAYRRIRSLQRNALVASSLPIPGYKPTRVTWSWKDVIATGLLEVSAPGRQGLPGAGQAWRYAVREVVTRNDVWLPDPDQLTEAYDRRAAIIQAEDREAAQRDLAEQMADIRAVPGTRPAHLTSGTVAYLGALAHNQATLR